MWRLQVPLVWKTADKRLEIIPWPHRSIAVETAMAPRPAIWILFILIFLLLSFNSFYTVSNLLSLPFSAKLFVLSLVLPCFAFFRLSLHPPFCQSLQPLRLFDPSLFALPLPALSLSLAGHPHFFQYARGWERQRDGRAKSINTKRPSTVTTLSELGTTLYN